MKILVTGAAGYLGQLVVADLLAAGQQVVGYDALLYDDVYTLAGAFQRGDVADADALTRVLAGVDVVVHLAAIVGDAASMLDPARTVATNAAAVQWLAQHFAGPLIFTSTCSVYGARAEIASETNPVNPQSLYAETKLTAEAALADHRAFILRLGTLHGLGGRPRFDLVVNAMAATGITRGQLQVFGGAQYRPLLAVGDAAAFIAQRATKLDWQPGIYNLATTNLTVREIAGDVQAALAKVGVTVTIAATAPPYEDQRNYQVDCTKAGAAFPRWLPTRSVGWSAQEVAQALLTGRIKDPWCARWHNARALEIHA